MDFGDTFINLPVRDGFVIGRDAEGNVCTNVPHHVIYHSVDGFEYGVRSNGSADLSINILETVLRDNGYRGPRVLGIRGKFYQLTWDLHKKFQRDFITCLNSYEATAIPYQTVLDWIEQQIKT